MQHGTGDDRVEDPSIFETVVGSTLRPFQKQFTDQGIKLYTEGSLVDPSAVDGAGKPIYQQRFVLDASQPKTATTVTEKPMSSTDLLNFRNFQLHQTLDRIERRDEVQGSLQSYSPDTFAANSVNHFLGTPFPIIEPNPAFSESFACIRWYEHSMTVIASMVAHQVTSSSPATRFSIGSTAANGFLLLPLCMTSYWFTRGQYRLKGLVPNEPEAYAYGTIESPERLAVKAERWRKYSNYKEEWMRRWNYYVWGQRPGETWNLGNSGCFLHHSQVKYNVKTDYPVRRNPYAVTTEGVRTMNLSGPSLNPSVKNNDTYMTRARPEIKHAYGGGTG